MKIGEMYMWQKLYNSDALSKQFAILVFLQPFIDIYRLFVGNGIEVAGISLVELVNILFIGYLGILFILNQKRWKSFALAGVYAILLGVYLYLHCMNILKFDTGIIAGTAVNVAIEAYVILRAYVLPVMLLYMMVYIKTEEERFVKTAVGTSAFISIVIVVTNIFKVSYISYASYLEENEHIRQNIIEWFTKSPPKDLNLITSKGWFYSGNQIGLILLILFPVVIYYAVAHKKKRGYACVAVQVVAMIMVATKTAALGSLLVIGIMIVLLAIFGTVKKQLKENLKAIIALAVILGGGALLLNSSPVKMMISLQGMSYMQSKEEEDLEEELELFADGELDTKGFSKFLNKYYYIYGIQEEFVKLFPVEQHPQFWLAVISNPNKKQVNFRDFKMEIYEQILELNDNPGDKYWGIGYTTNFPYMERDVIAQAAWFGSIGAVLFLCPFALVFLLSVFNILRRFREKMNLYICTLGLGVCAGAGGALMAGHLIGYFFPVIIWIYLLAQLYHESKEER